MSKPKNSRDSVAAGTEPDNQDFTIAHYHELLSLAKAKYEFVHYNAIPNRDGILLWRHDCDFSLNRAHRLALIEQEEGVSATYFINPHSEFYNPFEKSQADLIRGILEAGHDLGLHFDAAFYNVTTEDELDSLVSDEAGLLERSFGTAPVSFSFHNPTEFLLTCEADSYGGLTNCYSSSFKSDFSYCSDSNGYWRFRRLAEVLETASDPRLQVLTHPGWWQENPSYPRQRVFRSVYGRAASILNFYDDAVEQFGRSNVTGPAAVLQSLKELDPSEFEVCDYLWSKKNYPLLFMALWRFHDRQIAQLCHSELTTKWRVRSEDVETFFENPQAMTKRAELFESILGCALADAYGIPQARIDECRGLVEKLIHHSVNVSSDQTLDCCVYLCECIKNIDTWMRTRITAGQGDTKHDPHREGFDSNQQGSDADFLEKWENLRSQFR